MIPLIDWSERTRRWPVWLRYAAALLLVLATFALRAFLADSLRALPFLLFFLPIIASAVVFDRGSGFVATLASALVIAYPPPLPFAGAGVPGTGPSLGLLLFAIVAAVCVAVIEGAHLAHAEAARTTAELAESELRFRAFAEAMPALMFVTDPAGANTYTNRQFRTYTGLPTERLLGDGWLEVLHPRDRERGARAWTEAVHTLKPYEIEYRFRRHDGAYRWHLVRGEPVLDAGRRATSWLGTCTDIEDIRSAAIALSESEARFRALIEDAPHKMWVTRPDGSVEFYNRAWRAYTGLDPASDAELWKMVTHPGDLERLVAARSMGLAGSDSYSVDIRLKRADGAYRWHLSTVTPQRRGGVIHAWIGTSVDIDDARMAEAALRRERDLTRLYFETAGVMLVVIGADRRVVDINRAGAATLGRPADAIIGRDWIDHFLPAETRQGVGAVFDRFVKGEADAPANHENHVLRADGSERLIAWRNATLRDEQGRFVATISSGLDVTDLRATEARLRESEERSRLIVENARDYAILTTDREGRITSWSNGAEAVFGFGPAEVIGGPAEIIFTPEDRAAGVSAQEFATARREGSAPDLRWHLRKDGARIWFNGVMTMLRGSAGGELGFLKIGRDETTAHRAEQLMREAVERQALLTREVGHRVKNNLAIINGLLALQARGAIHDETRTALAEARSRIDAIAQVHDHLWRQDAGDTIDLDSFLRELCAHVQATVPRHALSYHGAGEPLAVPVDRAVTLSLIVNELITNAAKYAYPDAEGAILVGLDRLVGAVRLSVVDHGIGMRHPASKPAANSGFGSRLLAGYARQLDAELLIDTSGRGTRVALVIPMAAIEARRPESGGG